MTVLETYWRNMHGVLLTDIYIRLSTIHFEGGKLKCNLVWRRWEMYKQLMAQFGDFKPFLQRSLLKDQHTYKLV